MQQNDWSVRQIPDLGTHVKIVSMPNSRRTCRCMDLHHCHKWNMGSTELVVSPALRP
jgi:hypothetical protein